jgi:hypothetical protein
LYLSQQSEIAFNVQSDDYHMFRLIHSNNKADWMGISNRRWNWQSQRGCCNQKKMQLTIPSDGWYRIVAYCYDTGGGENIFMPDDANNNKRWNEQGFCRGCLPGFYSDTTDTGSCKQCPVAKYTNEHGQSSCKLCDEGKYTTSEGQDELSDCISCPRSTYSDAAGSPCKNCPAGKSGRATYTGHSAVQRCIDCGEGTYETETGQDDCKLCSKGFYTAENGQNSPEGCLSCEPGRYNAEYGLKNSITNYKCLSCPTGYYQNVGKGVEEYSPYFKTDTDSGIGKDCTTFSIDETAIIVTDLQACKIKCGQHILCQGISYDTSTKACVRRKFACSTKTDVLATSTFYGRHLIWSCKGCEPAKYADNTISSTCKDCPTGYYLEGIASTTHSDCAACELGKYGDQRYTTATGCKICSGGKYNENLASATCSGVCVPGRFATQSSTPLGHDNVNDCIECPAGFFQPGAGEERCLGCPGAIAGATACDGCLPGKWKSGETCLNCGTGLYTDSVNKQECSECPAGFYAEGERSEAATGCDACSAGFYSTLTRQHVKASACIACSKGRYSTVLGANSIVQCTACDAGRYNEEQGSPDPSSCSPCTPGKWNNDVSSISETACRSCLLGKYSADVAASSAGNCKNCPQGWYQGDEGQTHCLLCVPGQAQSKRGQGDCEICTEGKYTGSAGLFACISCEPGTFANSKNMPLCYECQPGKYGVAPAAISCDDCAPGMYQNETKKSNCFLCLGGKISSNAGASSCSDCQMGKYQSVAGSIKCDDCNVGYYMNSVGETGCKVCLAGRFSSRAATVECPACLPGKHAPNEGTVNCNDCAAGLYENNGGASECEKCEPGKSSPMGMVECLECLPGRYANASASIECNICPGGYYTSETSENYCKVCLPGTFSLDMAITCSLCAKGTYNPNRNQSFCTECAFGSYQPKVGSPGCKDCPEGWATNGTESVKCAPCVEGRYSKGWANALCTKCPIGWKGPKPELGGCDICKAGRSQELDGAPSCIDCQPGYYAPTSGSSACLACEVGQYQKYVLSTTCEDCAAGFTAMKASRICSPMPDSKDVKPPRVIFSEVLFDRAAVLDRVPLSTHANATKIRLVVEEPRSAISSRLTNLGETVSVIRTHVRWSTRTDYSDETEIGRFLKGVSKYIEVSGSTNDAKYYQAVLDLGKHSLYEPNLQIRIRVASYLSDTSWTAWRDASILPCSSLLGAGTDPNLPCPKSNTGSQIVVPEPKIISIFYDVPTKGMTNHQAFHRSVYSNEKPKFLGVKIIFTVPSFKDILFNEDELDQAQLRPINSRCLFSQIEWSPDSDFSRLRVGARVSCGNDGPSFSTSVSNFNEFSEFSGTIFSYPGLSGKLYFRVKTYLDDTSSTSYNLPATIFPAPAKRGSENAAPQVANNRVINETTMELFLSVPSKDIPAAPILFLEVQFSTKREFRETVTVSYSRGNDDDTFIVSNRVRIMLATPKSKLANVNVTFDEEKSGSIFVQKYFIRVSAVYSDGSTILQDQTYDLWGAFARGCEPVTASYLQTHYLNDDEQPYKQVQSLTCQPCPLGASCSGDFVTFSDIVARSGYRRLSWNHSVFGACPVKDACLGVPDILDPNTKEVLSVKPLKKGDKEKFENCREGHLTSSELCSDCIKNYLVRLTANPPGTCSLCPEEGTNFALFFLMIVVALGYMGFLIYDSLMSAKILVDTKEPMPFHTIALRILSSYLQVAGMLMSFKLTLPESVKDLVTIQRSASAVVEQTLSFDCTAGSRRGLELFFLKQTIAVILPLLLPTVSVVWIIIDRCKKGGVKYLVDKIICSIVVLYYLVFPAIVSRIAITFACATYGDDGYMPNKKFLMQRSLTTSCWSEAHNAHIYAVTIPAICLYLVLCPLYLTITLVQLREKKVLYFDEDNFDPRWTYRLGFLFAGYEPRYAWWEIVVLLRKACFVLVTVFARPAGMAAQVIAATIVLILSLSVQIQYQPYDHDTHDDLESAGLHASLITLPSALLANEISRVYGTGSTGEGGQQLLGPIESIVITVVAFSSFSCFVYFFIHGIVLEAQHNRTGWMRYFSQKLCKKQRKYGKSKAIRKRAIKQSISMRHMNAIEHAENVDEINEILNLNKNNGSKEIYPKNQKIKNKLLLKFQQAAHTATGIEKAMENLEKHHETRKIMTRKTSKRQISSQQRLKGRLKKRNSSVRIRTAKAETKAAKDNYHNTKVAPSNFISLEPTTKLSPKEIRDKVDDSYTKEIENLKLLLKRKCKTREIFVKIFPKFDQNKSGAWSKQDFLKFLSTVLRGEKSSTKELKKYFSILWEDICNCDTKLTNIKSLRNDGNSETKDEIDCKSFCFWIFS